MKSDSLILFSTLDLEIYLFPILYSKFHILNYSSKNCEVPKRDAPALISSCACETVRMPPVALIGIEVIDTIILISAALVSRVIKNPLDVLK